VPEIDGWEYYAFADVVKTVSNVYPCIEIAECRFTHRRLPPAPFIQADGFASGHYVLGEPIADWRARLGGGVVVQLLKNGEPHSQGHSSDVMGHPLNPVVWLANALRRRGRRLEAGDLVSSGSCNILCKARAGDVFEARYAGLPPVCLEIM
jgi:2-keto-4-pentenoate hydratase